MVMLQSLRLLQRRLVLDLSSRSSPSQRQQHLYLRRQILCLQSMVVFASAQSRNKSPNSSLPLPGKQVADSLVILVLERQLQTSTLVLVLSLFAILVSESNQNPSLLGFLLVADLSSRLSPSPSLQHSYLRRRRHSSDSLALLRTFSFSCMGDSRDYPSAAQRITQDLRSAQAYWFWFYLCSRFWCQNRTRILYSIHSRRIWKTWWIWWCCRSSWCKPTRRLYSLHSYGSGRYSSAHLLRAEVCSGKIPSRRGIHYLPTQSYRDWSATCRSSWRTGRVLYSCSRSWNWKTLWIQWCSRSSSLQSNRQDYPLLLRGQCYRERDQFHGRVWISLRICIWSRSNCSCRREAGTVLLRWQSSRAYYSCSTRYNWWTLWILQHNRSEGLRLSRAHYTLQVPWNSRRECIYCRRRNCNSWSGCQWQSGRESNLRARGYRFDLRILQHHRSESYRSSRTQKHLHRCWQRRRERDQCRDWFWYTFWICWWSREHIQRRSQVHFFTIGGDTVGGDVKFTAANLAVGQVRIGLSNDGIPGDGSRGITIFRLRTFPEGPKVRFTGTKAESFTPAPHIAEGLIDIEKGTKDTKSRYIEYRDPQPTRIVVI